MLAQKPIRTRSGAVRITDSKNFPVATAISAALVEVQPGGMRELHWHPNADEWQYYIEGQARMGVFGSTGNARTFDYRAGDVGYVPFAMGHYVENTGDGPAALPGDVQERALCRRVAQPVAGADAAGTGPRQPRHRREDGARPAQEEIAGGAGLNQPGRPRGRVGA